MEYRNFILLSCKTVTASLQHALGTAPDIRVTEQTYVEHSMRDAIDIQQSVKFPRLLLACIVRVLATVS
jgi:hypothetical protein